jgi:hypothetical protein
MVGPQGRSGLMRKTIVLVSKNVIDLAKTDQENSRKTSLRIFGL